LAQGHDINLRHKKKKKTLAHHVAYETGVKKT